MAKEQLEAIRQACADDEELAAALAATSSLQEWVDLANARGFAVELADLPAFDNVEDELSDSELEAVSGGYTFPRTDWVYCDNPWTNVWCTLKC